MNNDLFAPARRKHYHLRRTIEDILMLDIDDPSKVLKMVEHGVPLSLAERVVERNTTKGDS